LFFINKLIKLIKLSTFIYLKNEHLNQSVASS